MTSKRLSVAFAFALALVMAGVTPPTNAMTFGKAVYRATISTGSGLTSPVPIGVPPVVYAPRTTSFTMTSASCDGAKTDLGKAKGTDTYSNLCTLQISGTVSGYCGRLTGAGSGVLSFHRINSKSVPFSFTLEVVGTKLVIRGTSGKGAVYGSGKIVHEGSGCTTAVGSSSFVVLGSISVVALHPPIT